MGFVAMDSLAARLSERSGPHPPAVFDSRIDWSGADAKPSDGMRRLTAHQALMRAYQNRYVVLPMDGSQKGSIVERLQRHYDPNYLAEADAARRTLEDELIVPLVAAIETRAEDTSCEDYVAQLLPRIRDSEPGQFIAFLESSPNRQHHYRNFLIQSSADLLAESSASALGIIGEFGEVQSALFRILIDEFGYGEHGKKHSQLYRATLRSFGLPDEYNGFWHLLDTVSLELHNTIHFLFQNPRNFFRQIGFLLYAETSYQKSTGDHHRYLRQHHKEADARYFGEHAHIDIHHTAMVVDEVVAPLLKRYGAEVGREIVIGAELTAAAFARSDAHLAALGKAIDEADSGVSFGLDASADREQRCRTPDETTPFQPVQIGGIAKIDDPRLFADLPDGTVGREVAA
ncbi:iron-containing redox enzyme family protein [Notoacmeibacter sp. MSK16QG-6]|uniref:iron-containing redox enzyme family protein n=1 Tax=Notoacmeibacter sp. MSK16QG-6 TaxID=2957982 RepID=UPI0020A1A545|nr:iron-containing redox enzyme family protein [Notoacmeibacter sp. MSK16QG-6]MCP1200238.1 iron-containing redox enzyme family protein [Notoacmeibacter sp. MSK16QG-6]